MQRTALALCLLFSGCSVSGPPAGSPDAERTSDRTGNHDSAPAAAPAAAELAAQARPMEEDARGQRARNPLVRGLEQVLDESPVLEDTDDLHTQLREADRILAQVKRENREALRQVNRQLIVGSRPPSMVLLVADDLGFGDLGCYGQQSIQTPHLDRLASRGLRLDQFYAGGVTSDSSWWCLMTGRYTARYDLSAGPRYVLAPPQVTLPETMWQGGYDTAFFGNWCLAGADSAEMPHLHGFDQWTGTLLDDTSLTHCPDTLWSDGTPCRIIREGDRPDPADINGYVTEQARTFLQQHRPDRPFLMVVAFTLPHPPWTTSADSQYRNPDWDARQRAYASTVSRLDGYVGEILNELAVRGLEASTLVMFTSDNAANADDPATRPFFASRGGLRGQAGELYEGAIRVPMIVRWPQRIAAGSASAFPAAHWDLLPTFAELGRVRRRPRPLDGVSLVPLFEGREPSERPRMYWQSSAGGRAQAVRLEPNGKWKAVRPAGRDAPQDIELYDLSSDVHETNNVADRYPDVVNSAISERSPVN